jgi:succinate dehydrogenase / fumarate reductase cytochrome b subunit
MKFPTLEPRTRSNLKGVGGWAWAGRYGIERHMYVLQRVTGLGVLLYLPMHLIVTAQKLDQSNWESVMDLVTRGLLPYGEFLVFVAAVIHAFNGIRLLLTHFGFLMRQPERPVYPFTVAALKQRWSIYLVFIASAAVIGYGGYEFFIVAGH